MKQIKQMGTMSTDKHMQKHIQKNHIHLPPPPPEKHKKIEREKIFLENSIDFRTL